MPGALAGLRAAGGPMECIATADVSQQFAALAEKGGEGVAWRRDLQNTFAVWR